MVACLLFFLSGCTSLVYEVVWTRQLILVLGGTTYAITTVVVAFMSGLALGSHIAGRLSDALKRPGRAYGMLEIAVGLYGLIVPLLLGAAQPLYQVMYPHVADTPWILTGARFLVSSVVLLIPATCMGATLPILVHYTTRDGDAFGRSVGRLYGINTLGAVLGTMLAGFWLIPALGLTHTTHVAAFTNLAIGLVAILLLGSTGTRLAEAGEGTKRPVVPSPKADRSAASVPMASNVRWAVMIAFALSGFSAMVYQIAWTRALIMSIGSSTYAFTCILAGFILGLGVGSLLTARRVDRWHNPVLVFGWLELALGLSAILMMPVHGRAPALAEWIVARCHENYGTLLWTQFMLVIAVTLVPTFLMGAIFPLVTKIIAAKEGETGAAVGRAYVINTLGTIVGSLLAGFLLIRSDVLGVQNSIVFAALLNGMAGAWLLIVSRPAGVHIAWRFAPPLAMALVIPLAAVASGRWNRELLTSAPYLGRGKSRGNRPDAEHKREFVYFGEGVDTTVSVLRTSNETTHYSLAVNGKVDASTGDTDMPTQLLSGHLPALLCQDGKKACVIGLASGMTLSAVNRYGSFEQLDCIEISEEVIKAAAFFAPYAYGVLTEDERLNMIRADARNHLLLTHEIYDLIVSEPSNPWISGVSSLFTKEYFSLAKEHLSDRGVLCIWLQAYAMSLNDFRMIAHTLCDVMGFVSIWKATTGDILFIAGHRPFEIPLDDVSRRFSAPAVRKDLYRIGIVNVAMVLGRFISSGEPVRQWASTAPIHTDDNALLEFSAPRSLYRPETLSILKELYSIARLPFDEIVTLSARNEMHQRLRERAADSQQGHKLWIRGLEAAENREPVAALRNFLDAYQLDTGDYALHHQLLEYRRTLLERDSSQVVTPELMGMLDQIDLVRQPTVTALVGDVAFTELAEALYARAYRAWREGLWSVAADYLAEAHDLDPDKEAIVVRLAFAMARLNRPEDAIRYLEPFLERHPTAGEANHIRAALAAQANDSETALGRIRTALAAGVAPETLREDRLLAPLRSDPRFEELLSRYATTQPSRLP